MFQRINPSYRAGRRLALQATKKSHVLFLFGVYIGSGQLRWNFPRIFMAASTSTSSSVSVPLDTVGVVDSARALATVRLISLLSPISGADLIEEATLDGWKVVVKKGEFSVGDMYFLFPLSTFILISLESISSLFQLYLF